MYTKIRLKNWCIYQRFMTCLFTHSEQYCVIPGGDGQSGRAPGGEGYPSVLWYIKPETETWAIPKQDWSIAQVWRMVRRYTSHRWSGYSAHHCWPELIAIPSLFTAQAMPARTKKALPTKIPLYAQTDNGICLPIGFFVLSGIVWAYNKGSSKKWIRW